MKNRFIILSIQSAIVLVFSTISLFGQDNVKIVEYKILKYEKNKKTELTVPKGQNWRFIGVVTRKPDKIEFYIEDDIYIFLYDHHVGLNNEFIPFILPEGTRFSIKPIEGSVAFRIAVLKIEIWTKTPLGNFLKEDEI